MTPIGQSFLQRRLQYLLLLRLLAVAAQVVALVLMVMLFDLSLPWLPVTAIIGALLLYTAVAWQHARQATATDDAAIFRQLLIDIIALSALVYYTGGSANPFITLFLLPITFAAASVRTRYAWPLAGLAVFAYTLLMFFNQPVLESHHAHGEGFSLHLWGMWYGFIISAALLVYFVGRIGQALRERERLLAAARENTLRADQLIAMGTLATGTAHELGTPLATMAVLVRDMEVEQRQDPEMHDNLRCLREQIDRCKQVLAKLASDTGQLQAGTGRRQPVNDYLQAVISEWRNLRQGVDVHADLQGPQPPPAIIADRTLTQALLNVLNNAADAGAARLQVDGLWSAENLRLSIADDGRGLPAGAGLRLGQEPLHSQERDEDAPGMGLGLFLARTTLQRFGGRLDIADQAGGGARVDIHLPLQVLLADQP